MRHIFALALILVTGQGLPVTASATEPLQGIILIGWDGAQRAHVHEMIARGEVPNLVALGEEGALVDIDITTGRTDTKAGWTQILTGYTPEKTGVYGNSKYQPIPIGYTVFERLEKAFGPEGIETVALVGKKGHVDADAPRKVSYSQWFKEQPKKKVKTAKTTARRLKQLSAKIVDEDGVKYVSIPGKPWYNAKDRMDLFLNGLKRNETVGKLALWSLEQCKDKRFFFFVHFAEPDHAGHKHGENSQQYTDMIKSDDQWTGKIIAKLKELGLYGRTLVYVTADHGFNEGAKGHSDAPYVFLATNDKTVTRNGDRADIAPTILKRFGVDLSSLDPPLDGVPLDEPERKTDTEGTEN
jgi:hypothetical protein